MKKISLMLCLCAMALVGLFVSCSNGEYIDSTSVSHDYLYKVTGTMKVIETEGAATAPVSTSAEYTITKATGEVWWTESVNQLGDVPEYGTWCNLKANLSTSVSSGTVKTYNVYPSWPSELRNLYKFSDGFYIKTQSGNYSKVTIDGDFEDESFTLSYSYSIDNGSTETIVDVTTYSGSLTFTEVTAE